MNMMILALILKCGDLSGSHLNAYCDCVCSYVHACELMCIYESVHNHTSVYMSVCACMHIVYVCGHVYMQMEPEHTGAELMGESSPGPLASWLCLVVPHHQQEAELEPSSARRKKKALDYLCYTLKYHEDFFLA